MKTKAIAIASFATLALPLVASAAVSNLADAGSLIINTINNVLVPVLFAVAFVVFLWGAFKTFIWGATDEKVKESGKGLMLWGLIGFFVMISIWGLVNILTNTADVGGKTGPTSVPKAGVQVGN